MGAGGCFLPEGPLVDVLHPTQGRDIGCFFTALGVTALCGADSSKFGLPPAYTVLPVFPPTFFVFALGVTALCGANSLNIQGGLPPAPTIKSGSSPKSLLPHPTQGAGGCFLTALGVAQPGRIH